ncbi:MAG: aminotransferase class IV [Chloroflexota bacterium]
MSSIVAVAVLGRGLVDPDAPLFAIDDVGMTRGQAAFETIRVYAGRAFALEEHLDRLIMGATRLGLPAVARDDLRALAAQAMDAAGLPDCALRYYWTGGREGEGRSVALATVSTIPPGFDEQRQVGITVASMSLGVDSTSRDQLPWLLSGVKSTSYAVNLAARAEAVRRGAEDALFMTADGFVLEGPTSNIWWRSGRTLRTPALDLGVLAGVTRTQIRALGAAAGYVVEEVRATVADVAAADEAWMSSSVRELMPIVALDGTPIGDGRPGPAVAALQAALRRLAHGE